MRNPVCVKIQIVPLLQKIKQRDRVSEPHLEIRPDSLPQMFKFTDLREQRKNRFNQHPLVLEAASGKRPHITIFGDDYPTPDGTAIRDYIHVSDLSQAHLLAVKFLQNGGDSEFINLDDFATYFILTVRLKV